jgi:hypothetical protein
MWRLRALRQRLFGDVRTLGWRGLIRRRGWKLVAVVIAYYLIRDVMLYVALPLAIAAGLFR